MIIVVLKISGFSLCFVRQSVTYRSTKASPQHVIPPGDVAVTVNMLGEAIF